jgi:hypothetical protein
MRKWWKIDDRVVFVLSIPAKLTFRRSGESPGLTSSAMVKVVG